MKKYSACQNGECKCGLIWDKDLDIPIAKILTCKDREMLGCGLIPESDEFKRVYKLLAAAPELLEAATRMERYLIDVISDEVNNYDMFIQELGQLQKNIMEAKGK